MALSKIRSDSLEDTAIHGNRNLIINGAMQVAQRGTSSTSTGFQTVDRFNTTASTDGTITQSQTALTSGDPYNDGFRNVYRQTMTSASSSPTSSHYFGIQVKIEAQNMANSGWQYASSSSYVTFSFWAKSSVAGTYSVGFATLDGTAQGYSFDYTLSANTWKKVTHAIPGNSNISFNGDNGEGFRPAFWIYLGGDYTTSGHTDESWAAFSSSSQTGDFAQNWMTTASATFDITGIQMELGEQATPFEHRSYGDELAACQRYYEQTGAGGFAKANSSTEFWIGHKFSVTKRANPTTSIIDPNSYVRVYEFGIGDRNSDSTPTISGTVPNVNGVITRVGTFSGISAGDTGMLGGKDGDANASTFAFDAEL